MCMTTVELKAEILKVLDELPPAKLPGVLGILKKVQLQSADDTELAEFLRLAFIEDRDVLAKLAQ